MPIPRARAVAQFSMRARREDRARVGSSPVVVVRHFYQLHQSPLVSAMVLSSILDARFLALCNDIR